jgi:glycosyltransferase involved in cell wall biosynthesis
VIAFCRWFTVLWIFLAFVRWATPFSMPLACGIPVISHAIRGIPGRVRNTVNRWMVPATGVGALADAIRGFPNNKARCTELGPNARRIKLEECSLELPARRYAELCASVV